MKRIVYVVAVGKPKFGAMAMGLGRSLKLLADDTPRVLVADNDHFDYGRVFDEVIRPSGPRSALDKLFACETTDAEQVLALDGDMLAFKRLDDILAWCAGKPFCVQGYPTREGSFHRRPIPDICRAYGVEQMPQFNGGLAYYERGTPWTEMLAAMRDAESRYESLGFEHFRGGMPSEEVCMLDAMIRVGHVTLIPPRLQFQRSAAGLVGKLRLDVMANECAFVERQAQTEFVRPYLFHAWRYKDFAVYWRQLRKLERLERYEDAHPPMHLPRWRRWQRSFEQRWMKLRGWL